MSVGTNEPGGYQDAKGYADSMYFAACDAHMRQKWHDWTYSLGTCFGVPLSIESGWYVITWTSADGELLYFVRVGRPSSAEICDSRSGRATIYVRTQSGVACPAPSPAYYTQEWCFQTFWETLHEAIYETYNWIGMIPDPESYQADIDSLQDVIDVLDIASPGNNIKKQIDDISGALSGLKGDFIVEIQNLLSGSSDGLKVGQLQTFCYYAHDMVVALRACLMAEQSIWQATRQDLSTLLRQSVEVLNKFNPGDTFHMSVLTGSLSLVGAFAGIFGGSFAQVGSMISGASALLDLITGSGPDLPSLQDTTSKSVAILLDNFVKALNGGSNSGSIANTVYGLEDYLDSKLTDLAIFAFTHVDDDAHNFLLRTQATIGATKTILKTQTEALRTVAKAVLNIVEDIKGAACQIQAISTNSEIWRRTENLGYDGSYGAYGAFKSAAADVFHLLWYPDDERGASGAAVDLEDVARAAGATAAEIDDEQQDMKRRCEQLCDS